MMTLNFRNSVLWIFLCFGFISKAQISISSESELRDISKNLQGHYILTKDIVLTKNWEPIGENSPFQGILDGNGHTISNLRIKNSKDKNVGFFARMYKARILNLGFEDAHVEANYKSDKVNAGIFTGEAVSTSIVQSYTNDGFVKSYGTAGAFVGKVVIGAAPTIINNSFSSSDVTALNQNGGGLVGEAENVKIKNAYFSGYVQAKNACGGILGSSVGDNSILSSLVLSKKLKGISVNRIVGERKRGNLMLANNYARTDMVVGNLKFSPIPFSESYIKGMQGENIPIEGTDYHSSYPDYTAADITAATKAFNDEFYSKSERIYYEYNTKSGKVAAIWTQAILLDIMMNNYLRTRKDEDLSLMKDILEGNRVHYANYDWDNGEVWFIYDDIMWWVISLARAYQVTGESGYLELSKSGFERVWSGSKKLKDNGSYDPVRSGMYWAWNQRNPEGTPLPSMGKMACINYPTVIGAMTLFEITQDSTYFRKGLEIFNWAQNNLFNKETGRVADSKHGAGNPNWKDHVYNQATCIGAAVMLYKATGKRKFLDDATLAANYTKNQMSNNGFLHFETGIEQGIYPAIFAQYIIRLIEDGKQYQYVPWLRYNINAGWANRIPSSGISFKDFANPAPNLSSIQSYDASGIPALMQVVKPRSKADIQTNCKSRSFYESNLNWDSGIWDLTGDSPKIRVFSKND